MFNEWGKKKGKIFINAFCAQNRCKLFHNSHDDKKKAISILSNHHSLQLFSKIILTNIPPISIFGSTTDGSVGIGSGNLPAESGLSKAAG